MDIQQKISGLETRLIELSNVMAASDAHASKCAKLGLDFRATYPQDYDAYIAANKEYNEVERKLAELKVQREEMEEEIRIEGLIN